MGYFRKSGLFLKVMTFLHHCPAAGVEHREGKEGPETAFWQLMARPPQVSLGEHVPALLSLLVPSLESFMGAGDLPSRLSLTLNLPSIKIG